MKSEYPLSQSTMFWSKYLSGKLKQMKYHLLTNIRNVPSHEVFVLNLFFFEARP